MTTVGIIGLGYVGIPLASCIAKKGLSVIGFDILAERVDDLNEGYSPLKHISNKNVKEMRESGFYATQDFTDIQICDAIIICVPTPLNMYREPDLSFIKSTMESISPHIKKGQLISLESTTWPGTTEEFIKPYIEDKGFEIGGDFYLVYSPEREDPGNAEFNTEKIPKILGGSTLECLKKGLEIYNQFIRKVVPVSTTQTAEMVKLLENIHRSVNIGLVNEMKILANRMGIDIFEVINAAASKPFGFTPYFPGPGVGGHCIPIDPFYLTWKAREFGMHTRFIELAGEINANMPDYVVQVLLKSLNDSGKAIRGADILVLGVGYKPNVDDVRESPSVIVMEKLRDLGANLNYSDPNVPVFPKMRQHKFDLTSQTITCDSVSQKDAIILLTNHSDFDYELIERNAKLIVDTRGVFNADNPKVRRA